MKICTMTIRDFIYIVPLFIWACGSQIDEVSQEMAEIRKLKSQHKIDLPQFHPVPTFSYSAQHLRSPFVLSSMPPRLKDSHYMSAKQRQGIKPALEQFPLEELQFKGSLRNQHGDYIALVQTPEGRLERVQLGAYIGVNQARVVQINLFQIKVLESAYDGKRGYVTRPRRLLRSITSDGVQRNK